jgi:uncharacterized protein
MNLKQRIDADLKSAMLKQDKVLVTTLRTLKSTLLYAEMALGKREQGLSDDEVIALLRKEAKKRQESADFFTQGGNQAKADAEQQELKVIEAYLPAQMDDEALAALVDQAFAELDDHSPQAMGRLIARVKELSGGSVDGGRVAAAVKDRLSS